MHSTLAVFALTGFACSTSWAGRLILEGSAFLTKPPSPVASQEGRLEFQYDRDFEFSRAWSFRFHPVFRATSTPEAWESQAVFDPREMNIQRERAGTFVRFGFFTPKWEGTDGVNPMDIASMKDWGDPLRTQTKASAGLQIGSAGDLFETEIFWVPKQTKSGLPGDRSPWWPRKISLPLRDETTELILPEQVDYEVLSREELNKALDHNAGLRIQARGEWGDIAIAGFEGAADWPILQPITGEGTLISADPNHTVISLPSPVNLLPIDYRRRTGAAFASWTWGETLFRTAVRHDQPLGDDRRLPGWSQQAVFGFERNFILGPNVITVIIQGAGGRRADSGGVLSIADLFDRAGLWGLRWPMGESWTLMASGFYSFRDHSRFSQIEMSYSLTDEWNADIFTHVLDGPPASLPGLLADRDRGGIRLQRSF